MQGLNPGGIVTFAAVWLAAAAAPGGNVAFTLSAAGRFGFRKALRAVAGLLTALLLYVVLVALGLDAALKEMPALFTLLRWLGVAYLLWLAWRLWTAAPLPPARAADRAGRDGSLFLPAFLICASNPKVFFAFCVLFPHALATPRPADLQLYALGATALIVSGAVHVTYAALGARLGRFLASQGRQRPVNRVFALCLALAGLALAFDGLQKGL